MMVPDEPHRFGDVAVVADHYRAVAGVQPTVVQKMHGEIDVRAFFLGLDYLFRAPVPDRLHKGHADRMAQKMPEVHFDLGPVVAKGAEIHVLPLRLRLVGGRA